METEILRLIEPTLDGRREFLNFAAEVRLEGKARQEMVEYALENFTAYVYERLEWGRGQNLPAGWVPSSEYWLYRSNGRIVGFVALRHKLSPSLRRIGGHIGYYIRPSERNRGYGTAILALMLEKARQKGLKRVLVTCDDDNLASARVIEKNGGVLRDTIQNEDRPTRTRRYWIDLKKE